jgi:TPR repeat protein
MQKQCGGAVWPLTKGTRRRSSTSGCATRTALGSQNDAEAVRWCRLVADQGHATAQFNIGGFYADGTGVAQNAAEAMRWYRLAANQGNAGAQLKVGVGYANGTGVGHDTVEAVRWFRLVADQWLALPQYNLGVGYYNGSGVPQDFSEAARWCRLAVEQGYKGDAEAQTFLASLGLLLSYFLINTKHHPQMTKR